MNNFIKLNSRDLKRWDAWYFRDVPEILKEGDGDNLGVIWKIENVTILKEREGDNLGN